MSKRFVYIFLFFFSILLSGKDVCARDSAKVEAWDRSNVDYRPASAEKMEAYKQMDEYLYDRYEKPETLWDKFKRWFWNQLLNSGISGKVFMYVLIGIAVLILLFVVLKLLGVNISGVFMFAQDNKVTNLSFKQGEDNIYDEKLESILAIAIKNRAYREAVRLMYLLNLRHLDSAGLIDWKAWKTNREYHHELSSSGLKEMFRRIIYNYEYAWYGQFNIEDETFVQVQAEFEAFEKLIQNRKISV